MNNVYITKISKFLPNNPISNTEIEDYLGYINHQPSKAKAIVLRNNGIKTRYYAIDKNQKSTHTNAQLTQNAIENLFDLPSEIKKIELLSCGTSTPDQLLPSHASMVHGLLKESGNMALNSATGVCNCSMNALNYAYLSIKAGIHQNAISTGSEKVSSWLIAEKFQGEVENLQKLEKNPIVAFNREFLRWMLSDGAGAFLLENQPNENQISLKIEFIDFYSYANELPTCMYAGGEKSSDQNLIPWADFSPEQWRNNSIFSIKQDTQLLSEYILKKGALSLKNSLEKHQISPNEIHHILAHISSNFFEKPLKKELENLNIHFSEEKWFFNLSKIGNVGSASIYLALEEIFNSNQLKKGEKILLCVPESARFSYSIALLSVC